MFVYLISRHYQTVTISQYVYPFLNFTTYSVFMIFLQIIQYLPFQIHTQQLPIQKSMPICEKKRRNSYKVSAHTNKRKHRQHPWENKRKNNMFTSCWSNLRTKGVCELTQWSCILHSQTRSCRVPKYIVEISNLYNSIVNTSLFLNQRYPNFRRAEYLPQIRTAIELFSYKF